VLAPARAAAQTDSTPLVDNGFHSGDWAVQFSAHQDWVAVSLLRFTAPTRAWLLTVRANANVSDDVLRDSAGGVLEEGRFSVVDFDVDLGRRFYHTLSTRAVAFHSIGVGFGATFTRSPFQNVNAERWRAFVEVGGTFLPSSHVGLGAAASVRGWRFYQTIGYFNRNKRATDGYHVEISVAPLIVTVYF
jgi:hypothetical protein